MPQLRHEHNYQLIDGIDEFSWQYIELNKLQVYYGFETINNFLSLQVQQECGCW